MTKKEISRMRDSKGRFTAAPDIVRNPRARRAGRRPENSKTRAVKEESTVKTVWIDNNVLEQMEKIMSRENLTFRALLNIFCLKGVQLYRQKHGTLLNKGKSDPSDII